LLPDHSLTSRIVEFRTQLLLSEVGFEASPHAYIELLRLGEVNEDWALGLSRIAEDTISDQRRGTVLSWDTPWLLTNIAALSTRLGDETLAGDVVAAMLRFADREIESVPLEVDEPSQVVAWAESLLVRPSLAGGRCTVFPDGIPRAWWGQNLEWHRVAADSARTMSGAVRWHGSRPALLWEMSGPAGLVIDAWLGDGAWHTTQPSGETLLPEPGPVSDNLADVVSD
jgi:hypothetical protein